MQKHDLFDTKYVWIKAAFKYYQRIVIEAFFTRSDFVLTEGSGVGS